MYNRALNRGKELACSSGTTGSLSRATYRRMKTVPKNAIFRHFSVAHGSVDWSKGSVEIQVSPIGGGRSV